MIDSKDALLDTRRVALAFALILASMVVLEAAAHYSPRTWINRDGRFYINTNVTLVEDGGLDQSRFAASWYGGTLGWNHNLDAGWSNVALGRDGERLPKHPILMPLLSTPLFWAFDLDGTLLFNLLALSTAGLGAFLFARRYVDPSAAALAALGLVLGTALRDYAYDYHVDVLLLSLWLGGVVALLRGRGALAGTLIGMTVVLKPTCLLWLPSLLLLWAETRSRRTLLRALTAGALVLSLFALQNWWLFGRPWWTGYNRTLVVVAGIPQLASHVDAFSTPLLEGLERNFSGPWGLRHRFTLFSLCLFGLYRLAKERRLYVAAATLAVVSAQLLFALYHYGGDRFQWPAIALLVPALGAALEGAAGRLSWLFNRLGRPMSAEAKAAWMTALLVVCASLAPLLFGRPEEAMTLALRVSLLGLLAGGLTRLGCALAPAPLAASAVAGVLLLPPARAMLGSLPVEPRPLLAFLAGGLLLGALAYALAGLLLRARWSTRRLSLLLGTALALLGAVGFVKRANAASESFHIESDRSLRAAVVHLEDVPCDFLAWEHMSWECSHHDRGRFSMVSLETRDGVEVAGERQAMLLIPSGLRGEERRVRWEGLPARGQLSLRWAIPDGASAEGSVHVIVEGEEVDAFTLPDGPTGEVLERRVDTSRFAGQEVSLEVRVRGSERRRRSVLALAGHFTD